MAIISKNRPNQKDFSFELGKPLKSIVSVQSRIPSDAFTASVLGTERAGNGVVIRDDGLILTIGYLITEAEAIWLTDHTGSAVQGHVLGYDQESGFALVQALGQLNAEAIEIGKSASLNETDKVIIAGHGGVQNAVSAEIISIREFAGYWEYLLESAIFTTPAHPNWGGAGVIGENGDLVGIGSLFIQHETTGEEAADGNMIVPIDLLRPIYDDLLNIGRPNKKARPWLGLFGAEVEGSIVVAALTSDGPAHRAYIRVGDIITAVSTKRVTTLANFFRQVWAQGEAGVEIPLEVDRDGEILDISITSVARTDMLKQPRLH